MPQPAQPLAPQASIWGVWWGWEQGTGCHDRRTRLIVGVPSQLVALGSQVGRKDGLMKGWKGGWRAGGFHKNKGIIPSVGVF